MNNFDAQCIGQYTKYYIIDRADFINKIQEGMSIEEYWYIQKNTKKVYVSMGTQNFKNPFLSYPVDMRAYIHTLYPQNNSVCRSICCIKQKYKAFSYNKKVAKMPPFCYILDSIM